MENSINPTDNEGLVESFPEEKWRGDELLCQINGFWLMPHFIPGIKRVLTHFKPLPTDIILSSFPKTGTTWLKSLLYSITNRSSIHSLVQNNPHELIPFLEIHVYGESKPTGLGIPADTNLDSPRIFSTHIPYQLLGTTLESSGCRVVYVTRNPKDTLVSMWHFVNRWKGVEEEEKPWELDEAVEKFCDGVFPCGPYYDHVLGYRMASLERPRNVLFVTYEELKSDAKTHVRRLGEFLGCPFGEDEEEVEEVVESCSFEVLSGHEVNKSEDLASWFPVPYNSFFRKASVGDHKNYLRPESIQRIDELTREKFHKFGFVYGI
ncbi:PREDICTED: cytosolic sulfotransferase 8-like [Ipomoea nil]|uniref:cytosolic sulfotransferase 8-like n=1 Tax=Ipomoea nil TaxID=35883 RepID=UPI000900CFA9|nr:PREDICTED: cytosolic sulfotransferase 8-like [Ipomoea nil]